MASKKKTYEVRRWVSFPAWYKVEADSALEARKIAYHMATQYVSSLKIDNNPMDEGDSLVALAEEGKVVLYAYEEVEAK
jgi:hypothetical protein